MLPTNSVLVSVLVAFTLAHSVLSASVSDKSDNNEMSDTQSFEAIVRDVIQYLTDFYENNDTEQVKKLKSQLAEVTESNRACQAKLNASPPQQPSSRPQLNSSRSTYKPRPTRTLVGHSGAVTSLALDSVHSQLVSASSEDHSIKFWNLSSGQCVRTVLDAHSVSSLAISRDSRFLISAENQTIRVRDLSSGEVLRSLSGHSKTVNSVVLSGNDAQVVSSSSDKSIKIWDLASAKLVRTLHGHSAEVWPLTVSGDGRWLVSGGWDYLIKVWDLDTGECVRNLTGHSFFLMSLAVSSGGGDGELLASGTADRVIKVWHLASGECLRTLKAHVIAYALVFDSRRRRSVEEEEEEQHLVSAGWDGQLRVWDWRAGKIVQSLESGRQPDSKPPVRALLVVERQEGGLLMSGANDKLIRVYEK